MKQMPRFRSELPQRVYDELLGTLGECLSVSTLARNLEIGERVVLRELRRLRKHDLVRLMPNSVTVWEVVR